MELLPNDRPVGLSDKEALRLLKKAGPNAFTQGKKKSPLALFAGQFKDILTLILVASTLLSLVLGEASEAAAIILIVLLNAVLGFMQEYRTEKTLDALKNLAAPVARVIRSGELKTVPASAVVPGDLLVLEAGDRVPADARLLTADGLETDESLLTGESLPVAKAPGGASGAAKIYMGTMAVRGRGRAVTTATGMQTEMGRVAGMLSSIEDDQTPLQKRLAQLGKFIAAGCLGVCAVVSVTGILRGEPVMNMIITGVSLAVAAVPEGLPAIVTISLALGVGRMLKRNALIRRLPAVETLGCATVICSDKTGTLTQNRMTVRRAVTAAREAELGSGKKPASLPRDVLFTLEIGAVCNNAEEGGGPGDPTETALLSSAREAGLSPETLRRRWRRLGELPFDSDRKRMSVLAESGGRRLLLVKGAPELLLPCCTRVLTPAGEELLGSDVRARLLAANDRMAEDALRVLAFAYKEMPPGARLSPDAERNLVFAGLQGMMDPPRPEAVGAVRKCRRAGIRTVMITGDHAKTAAAVAKELGILRPGGSVVTGAELDSMSDAQLARSVRDAAVFARVSPAHKLRIVRAFKKNGNIVAMTGDGVNDAPAVKEADIGVSMGRTGTDVTKEASSVILLDDNFASMVAAAEEGRVIYDNIRKFIRYLLSCNIGEVLTMFAGMLLGLPVVLTPIQILWVNLVTDGLPAIALSLEPPDDDVMERKPRGVNESVFSHGLASMMVFRGCVIGLSTLGAFLAGYSHGGLPMARTAAFLTLVAVQLVHVFECKSETKTILHIPFGNNPPLILAVLVSLALILAAVYLPLLQPVFGTVALGPRMLLWVLAYSAIGPVLAAVLFRKRAKR